MSDTDLSPRTLSKKAVSNIIITIATMSVLGIGAWAWSYFQKVRLTDSVKNTLEQYAADINRKTFDASKYFSNSVPTFFEKTNMSPRLIDIYWKEQFEKVFGNYVIRLDYSTLEVIETDDGCEASIEYNADFIRNKTKEQVRNFKSRYAITFDREFRIKEITEAW